MRKFNLFIVYKIVCSRHKISISDCPVMIFNVIMKYVNLHRVYNTVCYNVLYLKSHKTDIDIKIVRALERYSKDPGSSPCGDDVFHINSIVLYKVYQSYSL